MCVRRNAKSKGRSILSSDALSVLCEKLSKKWSSEEFFEPRTSNTTNYECTRVLRTVLSTHQHSLIRQFSVLVYRVQYCSRVLFHFRDWWWELSIIITFLCNIFFFTLKLLLFVFCYLIIVFINPEYFLFLTVFLNLFFGRLKNCQWLK